MKRIVLLTSTMCCALPLMAHAYDAYTVADISLQAGPDSEYPSITELPEGAEVSLQGCIDGFTWCDVVAGEDRGWVPGDFLAEDYDNQPVIVTDYGPRIGIPVVSFELGVYWDQHYHNRSWFGERQSWEQRHIQSRAKARPPQAAHPADVHRRGGNNPQANEHGRNDNNNHPQNEPRKQATPAAAQQRPQAQQQVQHQAPRPDQHPEQRQAQHPQEQPREKAVPNVRNDQREGTPLGAKQPPQVHDKTQQPPHEANAPKPQPPKQQPAPQRDESKQRPDEHKGDNKGDKDKDH